MPSHLYDGDRSCRLVGTLQLTWMLSLIKQLKLGGARRAEEREQKASDSGEAHTMFQVYIVLLWVQVRKLKIIVHYHKTSCSRNNKTTVIFKQMFTIFILNVSILVITRVTDDAVKLPSHSYEAYISASPWPIKFEQRGIKD